MPWKTVKLNDGREMPSIAFGTWKITNDVAETQVSQAVEVGFNHIDTAQGYRNEYEAGLAIKASGLSRDKIFITTKYSVAETGVKASIKASLEKLGVDYVDLYLIHHPRLATPDIPTAWKLMEEVQAEGLAKSIGVSNFEVADLAILLASARVKPAANQILLHPYVLLRQLPILEYCAKEKIVIEAYSALTPLTGRRGGPVDVPVNSIASDYGVTPEQVLLAWVKAKGAVAVTTSSKKTRLEGYLNAGDLDLTTKEIASIDAAGVRGSTYRPRLILTSEEEESRRKDRELVQALVRAGLIEDPTPAAMRGSATYERLPNFDEEKGLVPFYNLEERANQVAFKIFATIMTAAILSLVFIVCRGE